MKPKFFIALFLFAGTATANAQSVTDMSAPVTGKFSLNAAPVTEKKEIRIGSGKWRITRNHLATGGFVFLAGMAKGFNETISFHWKEFHRQHPGASAQWFYPTESWKNKYKNGDPEQGPKYFLSTSVLIMFTDQYHLNNFINKMAWGSALVFKLGEAKKPFKQYLLDFLYYGLCHQAGFALTYYPFSKYKGK